MWLFRFHPDEPRTPCDSVARFVGGPLDGVDVALPTLPFLPDSVILRREGAADCVYVLSPAIQFVGLKPLYEYRYAP